MLSGRQKKSDPDRTVIAQAHGGLVQLEAVLNNDATPGRLRSLGLGLTPSPRDASEEGLRTQDVVKPQTLVDRPLELPVKHARRPRQGVKDGGGGEMAHRHMICTQTSFLQGMLRLPCS